MSKKQNSPVFFYLVVFLIQFSWVKTLADPKVPALYVFGDSLVDSGNNNLLPTLAKANYMPYGANFPQGHTGRFTNGKTTADFIAEFLGLPLPLSYMSLLRSDTLTGYNYASALCGILSETGCFAGKCLNFDNQIDLFQRTVEEDLPKLQPDPQALSEHLAKSLLLLSIGSNDYLNNYFSPVSLNRFYSHREFAKHLIDSMSSKLERLYNLGARRMLVFDIGPIGCVPYIRHLKSLNDKCDDEDNKMAQFYNGLMGPMLKKLEKKLPGSTFMHGKVFKFSYEAITNPSSLGFSDSANSCCLTLGNKHTFCTAEIPSCDDPDKYIFWDGFHLTEAAYSLVASRCINDSSVCSPTLQEVLRV